MAASILFRGPIRNRPAAHTAVRIDEREVSKETRASLRSQLNGRRTNNDRDANRGCAE